MIRNIILASAFGLVGLGFQVAHAHDSEIYKECYKFYEKSELYLSAQDKAERNFKTEEARRLGMLAKVAILEFNQCQEEHEKMGN